MTSLCRYLSPAQEIVKWVTTADGCVHTADATQQLSRVGVGGVYWTLCVCSDEVFLVLTKDSSLYTTRAARLVLSSMFVCLFVCQHDNS